MPDRPLIPDVLHDLGIAPDDLLERLALPSADVRLHELVVERDVDARLVARTAATVSRARRSGDE